jgi:hypothetical protein
MLQLAVLLRRFLVRVRSQGLPLVQAIASVHVLSHVFRDGLALCCCTHGAEERTRTSTGLPPQAPEACVSTNSTTSASLCTLIKHAGFVNVLCYLLDYDGLLCK